MRMIPDYNYVEKIANGVLSILGNHFLPTDLTKIYSNYKNLKVKSYSWFAKLNEIYLSDVANFTKSESGCCYYYFNDNKYLILYNEKEPQERIRWTIAHELGHMILKHNEISKKSILGYNGITEEEYKKFEQEANCFARVLLAPPNVLMAIYNIKRSLDYYDVMTLCDISFQASQNIISFFNTGNNIGRSYSTDTLLVKKYNKFIYRKQCLNCNTTFIDYKNSKYCKFCGHKDLKWGGFKNMIYPNEIEVKDGRALKCPICENEELEHGDFCKICGNIIVNKCTNEVECGILCDGSTRYCYKCGCETTFYRNNYLNDWKKVKENLENKNEFITIDDTEELPF